ncbi:AraC family transcriptional regulator [Niabella soli]|uniref:AraC family transcriptional regulator n=1 Tax=Niabella soli DSM 19437 TaxID=929713 RepID=W0F4F4_9BACT|nr:AraC family transcriptional regulator [Niabella soli]AHF16201.1 AraC family transcriptional regulator [Niabella soli DSM 19437]
MKAVEWRLPQEIDKSFILFEEKGTYFVYPWHYHPEYELVLITKSTGRRMVGDHIGYFQEGDLVLMGPALPHVWVNDDVYVKGEASTPAEAIVVQFVPEFLGQHFLNIPEIEPFRKILLKSKRGLAIRGKACKMITSLMIKMRGQNGLQRLASLLTIFDILSGTRDYELLASPTYEQSIQATDYSDRFSKITDYIMRNFNNDIALHEIAGVANMGVTAFCNFFKQHHKATFVEYLNIVRIGHACKLLGEKNFNVVEIAYECGYNTLANFNRQFKKIKSMTPSEYRKTLHV